MKAEVLTLQKKIKEARIKADPIKIEKVAPKKKYQQIFSSYEEQKSLIECLMFYISSNYFDTDIELMLHEKTTPDSQYILATARVFDVIKNEGAPDKRFLNNTMEFGFKAGNYKYDQFAFSLRLTDPSNETISKVLANNGRRNNSGIYIISRLISIDHIKNLENGDSDPYIDSVLDVMFSILK